MVYLKVPSSWHMAACNEPNNDKGIDFLIQNIAKSTFSQGLTSSYCRRHTET